MAKKIKNNDIFQGDLFLSQKDSAIAFLGVLIDLKKEQQELLATYKDLIKNNPAKTYKDVKALDDAAKKTKTLADSITKLNTEEQKQIKTVKALTAEEAKLKVEVQEKNRVTKLEATTTSISVGAYKQLNAQLNLNKKAYKDLAAAGLENTKQAKELNKTIQEQDARLKAIDASTGEFNRNVGNYKGAITEAFQASGLLTGELSQMKEVLSTLKEGFKGNIQEIKNLGSQLLNTQGLAGKANSALSLVGKTGKAVGKIGLIALVAGAAAFFTQFEEGQDILEKWSLRIQSVFGLVVDYLGRLFENIGLYTLNLVTNIQLLAAETKNIFTDNQKEVDRLKGKLAENAVVIENNKTKMAEFAEKFGIAIKEADAAFEKFENFDKILTLNAQRLVVINGLLAIQENKINDITLSFDEREKAEEKALKLATEKGKIDLENIKLEEERFLITTKLRTKATDAEIQTALATGIATDKITQSVLDNIVKRKTATIEVQNEIDLALEKLEQAKRERLQKGIKIEVNILQEQAKFRLATNLKIAESELLPYEEKIKGIRLSFAEAIKTNDDELSLLQKTTEQKIQIEDLLKEKSATALAEKIRGLQLSAKLEPELASVIQDRIELIQQEIDLLDKVAEAERKRQEAADIKAQKTFTDLRNEQNKIAVQKAKENSDAIIEEQVRGIKEGNAINEDAVNSNLTREYEAKKKALEDEFELEVANGQLVGEELKLATLKNEEELRRLKLDAQKKAYDEDKKLKDLQAEEDKKRTAELVKNIDTVTNAAIDGLTKRNQKQQEAADKEIETRKSNIERQQELASKGLENSLLFEQEQLAKAELEKKRLQDEQERREKRLAYYKAFGALVAEDPNNAAIKALSQLVIAESIVKFLADGEENLKGPGTTRSDSIPAMLSKGESVTNAKGTAETPGLVTAINKKGIKGAHEWFEKHILPKYFNAENINMTAIPSFKTDSNPQMMQKLDKLTDAVKNKKEINISWDGLETRYETMIGQGFKKTIKYVKQRPRI